MTVFYHLSRYGETIATLAVLNLTGYITQARAASCDIDKSRPTAIVLLRKTLTNVLTDGKILSLI